MRAGLLLTAVAHAPQAFISDMDLALMIVAVGVAAVVVRVLLGQLDTSPARAGRDRTRLWKAQGSRFPRDRRTHWEGRWGPLALFEGDLGRQTRDEDVVIEHTSQMGDWRTR
jgi:hypothetical protein